MTAKLWWRADAIRFPDATAPRSRAFRWVQGRPLEVMLLDGLDCHAHFQSRPGRKACPGDQLD
jgi:hypothetical protein